MVGNVIQTQFLRVLDYPTAAALSFILMAVDPARGHRLHPPLRDGGPGLMPVLRWIRRNLVVIAGLLTLAYMILPNVVVMVFSFNKPKGRFNYAWQQFSLDAWKDPCGVADLCGSLSLSPADRLLGDRSARPCSAR